VESCVRFRVGSRVTSRVELLVDSRVESRVAPCIKLCCLESRVGLRVTSRVELLVDSRVESRVAPCVEPCRLEPRVGLRVTSRVELLVDSRVAPCVEPLVDSHVELRVSSCVTSRVASRIRSRWSCVVPSSICVEPSSTCAEHECLPLPRESSGITWDAVLPVEFLGKAQTPPLVSSSASVWSAMSLPSAFFWFRRSEFSSSNYTNSMILPIFHLLRFCQSSLSEGTLEAALELIM